jgi:hypothetical protein
MQAPVFSFSVSGSRELQFPRRHTLRRFVLVGAALFFGLALLAQNPNPRQTLLQPEANRPPDANALMKMDQQHRRKNNFDAANALRQQQIDDETKKLLILANDLKQQMDKLGDRPVSDHLVREAEVIEALARDVQKKMTLTIKGS